MDAVRAMGGWACWLSACAALHAAELRVAADDAVADAVGEVVTQITEALEVALGTGPTEVLARRVAPGEFDLVILADGPRFDDLLRRGVLDPATVAPVASNSLVVIAGAGRASALRGPESLGGVKRIAAADPSRHASGAAALAYLKRATPWAKISSKWWAMDSPEAVLAAVESGRADAGIVRATDAFSGARVEVAWEVDPGVAAPVRYMGAVVTGSPNRDAALALLRLVCGDAGREAMVVRALEVGR